MGKRNTVKAGMSRKAYWHLAKTEAIDNARVRRASFCASFSTAGYDILYAIHNFDSFLEKQLLHAFNFNKLIR